MERTNKPNRIWKVDWPKVAKAERWLAMRAPDRPIETAIAEATPVRSPRRPETGPTHAQNVFGVLAARCAGHRDCPEAAEVVEGIANRAPTERQLRAIRVFIRASTPEDVRRAWKAGEFRLSNLMEKMERWIDAEAIPLMRGVHQWMRAVEKHER